MRWLRGAAVVAVIATALGASPALAVDGDLRCSGDPRRVRALTIEVAGEPATGRYATPAGRPKGLVVFFHGYRHTSASWAHHLARVAAQDGVLAVAMDYRGTRPDARGWRVAEGAADSIAAADRFLAECRIDGPTVAHGVSMGGNASGLAVAAGGIFDWWVSVEGVANVLETYLSARALYDVNDYARGAVDDIEEEMGGSFAERPKPYLKRTVVLRAADIAASGVRGVALVHGVGDGLVPYNQTRELAVALRAHGIAVHVTSVGTRPAGTASGTTIDGYVPVPHESPFAGHGTETDENHAVIKLGFERLRAILAGQPVRDGEVAAP